MPVRAFLAGCLLSLAAAAAAADQPPPASFDCDGARGVDERIICADPLLRQADFALGERYKALLAATGDAARRAAIRADEREWTLQRNRECRVTRATKIGADTLPAYVDCFLEAYGERAADLARMEAEPGVEPSAISSPIRKSLFAAPAPAQALAGDLLVDTGVVPAAGPPPAWRGDGGLVMVAKAGGEAGTLVAWRPGAAPEPLAAIEKPQKLAVLCVPAEGVTLVVRHARNPQTPPIAQRADKGELRDLRDPEVTPAATAACGLDRSRLLAGDGKRVLDLGPRQAAAAQGGDRFLAVRANGAARPLDPPVRIDRRLALRADLLPFADGFVVAAQWPADLRPAVERRWAKTGCLGYWRVAATGAAMRECIPYGDYVGEVPQPLPTKAGTFFAVPKAGLFRVTDGAARLVVPGPLSAAAPSPDGCLLAFATPRTVMVLDA